MFRRHGVGVGVGLRGVGGFVILSISGSTSTYPALVVIAAVFVFS